MNKNKKIILSIISILILSCAFTNPNKKEYINWAMESMQSNTTDILERGLVSFLGKTIISDTTTSKNYILFSIYKTEIDDEKLTTLAIFKNFIPINKGKVTNESITKGVK